MQYDLFFCVWVKHFDLKDFFTSQQNKKNATIHFSPFFCEFRKVPTNFIVKITKLVNIFFVYKGPSAKKIKY